MNLSKTNTRIALISLVLAVSTTAAAVTTEHFLLDSADAFFAGELDGAAVSSDGSVRAGAATERTPFENVPIAYSMVQRGGVTFVGTGTNGVIYRFDGKALSVLASTGELLVSSMAFGSDGALYAGTLPNGRIYRVDVKSGKTKRFSIPEGAKHIWALRYDKTRGRLIAGTGPEGRVYEIDPIGRAKELYDAEASHVMTLALDGKGAIYAGTSDDALVLRIDRDNRVEVVYDFPGNEVTAIDYADGQLAVASNQFKTPPGSQFQASTEKQPTPPSGPATRPRPGSGQLWRVGSDGRAEMLVSRADTHFTAVQWGTDGSIYVGDGHEGRIFRIEADASYSIWVDVEERQILALGLRGQDPSFVTGDGASIYRVQSGKRRNAMWTSKALDASFMSRWGLLTWRGRGRFAFQTRSGNTQQPGDTWSAWSKDLDKPGRVTSPPGRFIQVRAKLPRDDDAALRVVELFYLPQNQRARVSEVRGSRPPPKRGEPPVRPAPPTSLLELNWNVVNPDRDSLRYRVAYREEGQSTWRAMFDEDTIVSEAKYTWDTDSIPDGYYVVRVEASDEPSNPEAFTLRSSATSEPIRVDNHPPRIERLEVKRGQLRGRVVDDLGPIARIQVAIDAGTWRDVFPTDSLLDDPAEEFELPLGDLGAEPHILAVRAFDAAGNQANREITVKSGR